MKFGLNAQSRWASPFKDYAEATAEDQRKKWPDAEIHRIGDFYFVRLERDKVNGDLWLTDDGDAATLEDIDDRIYWV